MEQESVARVVKRRARGVGGGIGVSQPKHPSTHAPEKELASAHISCRRSNTPEVCVGSILKAINSFSVLIAPSL